MHFKAQMTVRLNEPSAGGSSSYANNILFAGYLCAQCKRCQADGV